MEIKVNKNQTRTAIYVRISTAQQKTDRQVVELKEYAKSHAITIDEDDIFIDVISGFKNGEIRPQYSVLKQKVEAGLYDQILFSEFSRLDRKPSNLLKSIEYYQSKGVHLYFKKQNIWIRDKSDISTQIMVSVLAVMSRISSAHGWMTILHIRTMLRKVARRIRSMQTALWMFITMMCSPAIMMSREHTQSVLLRVHQEWRMTCCYLIRTCLIIPEMASRS